jgi:hypothetical protein
MIQAKFTFGWAVPLLACAMGCSSAPVETPAAAVDPQVSTESASSCVTASNCRGPLPNLCKVCGDGSDGCAHWACVSGQCQIEYCAPECVTAADCHGALPALCRTCSNGEWGCAHHVCVAGQCEVGYCASGTGSN